ncbi:S-layer homology domain-containing protein [Bengtsoniella intestinalis]|uniref:S-layer homology domain-containing protein n=1 Tax=Bengtsoniella intestinalis TaxID=3073143 RepID=UPI00391F88BF
MKTIRRTLLTTMFLIALTCGLSITASAVTNLGDNGLVLPSEGTGTFSDTNFKDTITVTSSGDTYTVTLSNATIEDIEQAIYFYSYDDSDTYDKNLEIVLIGTNTIVTTGEYTAAIQVYCKNFTLKGDGTLSVTTSSGGSATGIDVNATGSVTFENSGKLTVNASGYGVNIYNYNDGTVNTATLSGSMDITGGSNGLAVTRCNLSITEPDVSISSTAGYDVYLEGYGFTGISITIPEGVCNSVMFDSATAFNKTNCNIVGLQVVDEFNDTTNTHTYSGTLSGAVTLDANLTTLLSSRNAYANVNSIDSGSLCNLTIASGATVTIPSGYELKLDDTLTDAIFDDVTVTGSIVNNGTLYIDEDYLSKVSGSGKTIVSGMIEVNGSYYKEGSDITSVGFDFRTTLPTEATCYTAGNGYVLFNPSTDSDYDADTITFFGASFSGSEGDMYFLTGDITQLVLSGTNTIVANYGSSGGSLISAGSLTVTGDSTSDSLTISGSETSGISANGALSVQTCTLTLKDDCQLQGTSVTITDSTVSVQDGEAVYGIYSSGGNISITNSAVDINATQTGIWSNGGNVTIGGTGTCNVEVTESTDYDGIQASGSVTIGGSVDGTISAAGYGIEAGDNSNITLSTTGALNITSSGSRGVYTLNGAIALGDAGNTSPAGSITICSSTEGIRTNGAVTAHNLSALSVTSTANTGIYSSGAVTFNGITDMTVSANGTFGIYGHTTTLTDIDNLTMTNTNGEGIYTSGYDVTLTNVNGTITATEYAIYAGSEDVIINTSGEETSAIKLTVTGTEAIEATNITIGDGAAVTVGIFYFSELIVEKGGTLTSAGNLVPSSALAIYETTALGAGTTIPGTAQDKCLLTVTAPTDAMVVVPSDLVYTGNEHTASTSLDITKANATVCGVTFTAFANGWAVEDYNTVTITDSDNNTTVKDAGEYTVTYSNGTTSVSNTFEVALADITNTTTATSQTVVLLDGTATLPTLPTGTTVDGSAVTVKYKDGNGDYSLDSVSYTAANTYSVYYELSAANHASTTGTISLTVQDIVFSDGFGDTISSTYGKTWADILAFDQDTYVATVGGVAEDGAYTLTIDGATYTTTDIPTVKANAGVYNWAVTFTSTPVDSVSTYEDMAVDSGTVTITNATITDNTTATEAVDYTGLAISITAPTGTTVNGQILSVTYSTTENGDYTATLPSYTNAGEYTVWYTLSAPNHDDLKASLTFTINQADSEGNITGNTEDDTKTYLTGGEDIVYGETYYIDYTPEIAPVSNGLSVMSLSVDELTFADETVVLYYGSTAVATVTDINLGDTATLEFTVTKDLFTNTAAFDGTTSDAFTIGWGGDDNANGTSKTVYFNLTKAALTATVAGDNTATKTYDGDEDFDDVTLTVSGYVTGDAVTATATGTTADADVATSKTFTANATVLDGTDAGYYTLATDDVTGNVEINAKDLADSMIATIADQYFTGSAITPIPTVTYNGMTLDSGDFTCSYTDNIDAGTATVTITAMTGGNYADADPKASKTFTIVQSGTVFTGGVTASNYAPTYGDTIEVYVTPTATGTTAVANSVLAVMSLAEPSANQMALFIGTTQITEPQTVTSGTQVTFTINTGDQDLVIGENTITAKYTAGDNMAAQEGTVTINLSKKAITTATIETGVTKEYDGNATFSDIDLVLGDDIETGDEVTATATLTRTTANAADDDTFTVASVSALSGDQAGYYTLATTGVATTGTVAITAKALTITTHDQEVTYGTAISSETTDVTVVGLITGEVLDSIVLTESDKNVATDGKTVNAATPVIKNGETVIANTNYDITYENTGDLTINAKSIVASWTGTTAVYDGDPQAPSVSFVGALEGDTIYTSMNSETAAGSYTVTLAEVNTNYDLSNPSTSFTISMAPITFTIGEDGTVNASDGYPAEKYTVTYTDTAGNTTYVVPTASGTYTVSVDIFSSSNYRIAGQTGSVGTIGTYTVGATFYTVTFGDESTMRAQAGAQIVISSGADKSATEVFAGWSYDGKTYKAGESFTQPSKDVAFEAVYSEVHDISGFVYAYGTTTGVEGVTITVVKGSTVYATDVTDATGAYAFSYIPADVYNVVAAYDATTKTELADISSANANVTITLPQYNTSSVLEVAAGTPDIVVGGLDDIAANYGNATDVVAIKLSVAQTSTTVSEIEEKTSNIAMYLDIDVTKTVNSSDVAGYNQTSGLVEFIIPIPADYQGKASYSIYREHEDDIHEITTTANSDGEYLEVSEDKTSLTLHVCKFSTYALAYTEYSSSSGTSTYSSSVASTDNGDVSISSSKNKMNATVTITTDPDTGYVVGDVSVTYASGREVSVTDNGDGTYSYKQPGAAVTVTVTFVSEDGEEETETLFTDVDEDAYYYDAVLWAVENGITAGYSDGTFRPTSTCTRAQSVTFLWRAAGEPEATMDNPFSDLDESAYYYDAVLWAVENGITTGYDDGTFRPDSTCNRGAIVTFMYRLAGEPETPGTALSDVADGAYYYDAVLWAVSEGITTGYSDGTFQPTTTCNRGAIVTFLYRYLG